jgi:TPP-dependent pyruvate/acetoin dehydrogenase alpha subunit
MRIRDLADRAKAYGIPAEIVDGNDVIAVYEATQRAAAQARRGQGPFLIEAKTFRMKGHAEHDNQAYVPKELLEEWKQKDPLDRYERWLQTERLATEDELQQVTARVEAEIEADLEFALNSPFPDKSVTYENVYATA